MASSLTSTGGVSSTVSSASLRRFSLLPTHHQQPNSVSLPRPTSFPAIRAQSSSSSSAGDSKVEKSAEEIKEISIDTLKEESERVNKEIEGVNEKIVEKIGQDANKAVADSKAVHEEIQKAAGDVAEKTAERVGDIWDAATGKS